MKNPERLINNAPFRALVPRAGFFGARALIRTAVVPLFVPPWKQARVRKLVRAHMAFCFPALSERALSATANAFLHHWMCKFSEDSLALSIPTIDRWRALIDRHVLFWGLEHFFDAVRLGRGVVMAGSHVGSPTFCNNVFLSRYLELPADQRPATRICGDPEIRRFPVVERLCEKAGEEYGTDLSFVYPDDGLKETAVEICQVLEGGGVILTNIDVLSGGSSQRPFPLFDDRIQVTLPALVGAARSALRTGAAIVPWNNIRTAAGFSVTLHPPLGPFDPLGPDIPDDHPEMVALCHTLLHRLEGWIRKTPEQWVYWDRLHRKVARPR